MLLGEGAEVSSKVVYFSMSVVVVTLMLAAFSCEAESCISFASEQ